MNKSDTAYFNQTLRLRERIAKPFFSQVQEGLQKMIRPILRNLERTETVEAMNHIIEATSQDTTQFLELLERLYKVAGFTYGTFVLESMGQKAKALDLVSNEVIPDYSTQDQSYFDKIMQNFADQYGAEKVVNISDTNRNLLKAIVKRGLEDGASAREVMADILLFFRGDITRARAIMIARTETMTASSYAQQATGNQLEKAGIKLKKAWLPTARGKFRPTHLAMASKKPILFEAFFIVGSTPMKHPHDPNAPASEVINCRCSIRYYPI
jgi:hypothetical protein